MSHEGYHTGSLSIFFSGNIFLVSRTKEEEEEVCVCVLQVWRW